MHLTARLDGAEVPLEVRGDGGPAYDVKVGSEEYRVHVTEPEPGVLSLLIGERSYEVVVRPSATGLRIAVAGRSYEIGVEDPAEALARSARIALSGTQVVRSIMAGRVLAVMVAEGEAVAEGKPLLVIEAMKMENEIRSPKQGTVKAVRVRPGQAVESGAELVVVE
jgi:biotin carboxyl carrier protein